MARATPEKEGSKENVCKKERSCRSKKTVRRRIGSEYNSKSRALKELYMYVSVNVWKCMAR